MTIQDKIEYVNKAWDAIDRGSKPRGYFTKLDEYMNDVMAHYGYEYEAIR